MLLGTLLKEAHSSNQATERKKLTEDKLMFLFQLGLLLGFLPTKLFVVENHD